jgi:hypothetical protein
MIHQLRIYEIFEENKNAFHASAQIQSPDSAHLPEDRRPGGIQPIQGEISG